jgi:hypothetical protein
VVIGPITADALADGCWFGPLELLVWLLVRLLVRDPRITVSSRGCVLVQV